MTEVTPKNPSLEGKELTRTLITVALPIATQSLIMSSLSLVDNLMIGQLGELELAAVGLSSQLFFVQWMVLFGFTSGCATFFAQFFGAHDHLSIRRVAGFAMAVCFSISLLLFLPAFFAPHLVLGIFIQDPEAIALGAAYIKVGSFTLLTTCFTVPLTSMLRATQQTHLPMKISIVTFTANTLLAYVLIFGKFGAPALGVMGAAYAILIARLLEILLTLFVVFGLRNPMAGKLRDYFTFGPDLVRRILRNAIPTTVNEGMWGLGMALYNAAYGRMGITAFASIQASNTINSMFVFAIFSLGDAMLILVGQQLGRKDMDLAYDLSKRLILLGVKLGAISGLALIIVSQFLVKLFEFTPQGHQYSLLILLIYGIFMPIKIFNGINITGSLRAGGDTRFAMIAEVFCVWAIGLPLVFLGAMVWSLPVYLVVLLAQAEEVSKAVVLFLRFRSKRWLNNVIHGIGTTEASIK